MTLTVVCTNTFHSNAIGRNINSFLRILCTFSTYENIKWPNEESLLDLTSQTWIRNYFALYLHIFKKQFHTWFIYWHWTHQYGQFNGSWMTISFSIRILCRVSHNSFAFILSSLRYTVCLVCPDSWQDKTTFKISVQNQTRNTQLDVLSLLYFRADVIEVIISLLTSLTKPDSSSRSERKEKSQTKNEQKHV